LYNNNCGLLAPHHNIKVVGQFTCYVRITPGGLSVSLTIIVIRDICYNVPTLLFGNDSFKACLATLACTGNVNDPTPEFLVHIPRQVIVPITQTSPQEIFTFTAKFNLQPYETKDFDFKLHVAAPVLGSDKVLIMSISIDLYSYFSFQKQI
jgi:hypothetical protein